MNRLLLIIGLCLFSGMGCAGPTLITHPVQDEPSLLIGLARYQPPAANRTVRHNHPMEWAEKDLSAILKRVFIRRSSGLMDSSRPLEAVFSQEEISFLTPGLRKAFGLAHPSDWIVFALWGSSSPSQTLEVTSGGIFLEGRQLHVILANHRERVTSEQDGVSALRNNPLVSLKEVQGTLVFHPADLVLDSRKNWTAGGFGAPMPELVLDFEALLNTENFQGKTGDDRSPDLKTTETDVIPVPAAKTEVEALKEEISNLKSELSRIKGQLPPQAENPSETKPSPLSPDQGVKRFAP